MHPGGVVDPFDEPRQDRRIELQPVLRPEDPHGIATGAGDEEKQWHKDDEEHKQRREEGGNPLRPLIRSDDPKAQPTMERPEDDDEHRR